LKYVVLSLFILLSDIYKNKQNTTDGIGIYTTATANKVRGAIIPEEIS